jgi:hypothetical protein
MTKSSEPALASGPPIFHRALMISQANISALTAVGRKQFSRVVTEKAEVLPNSSQIMAGEIMRLYQQLPTMAWPQFLSGGMGMAQLVVRWHKPCVSSCKTQPMASR